MMRRVRSGDLGRDNRNKLEGEGCGVIGDLGLGVAEGTLRRAREGTWGEKDLEGCEVRGSLAEMRILG